MIAIFGGSQNTCKMSPTTLLCSLVPSQACNNTANTVWWQCSRPGSDIDKIRNCMLRNEKHFWRVTYKRQCLLPCISREHHLFLVKHCVMILGFIRWDWKIRFDRRHPNNPDKTSNKILLIICFSCEFPIHSWNCATWFSSQYFGWIALPGPRKSSNVTRRCLCY